MGSLTSAEQRKLAYFHALGKVMTENTQAVYESPYKSSHNVRLSEIWSDDIAFANDYAEAVAESVSNDAVTLFEQEELTQMFGSNGQAYNLYSGSTFIRPWISPVDIPDTTTNLPSNGYSVRLFDSSNAEIYLTVGAWSVDYYAGIIHFSEGYTPADLGYGAIKATVFQYSGQFGAATGSTSDDSFSLVEFDSGTTQLIFNSGGTNETLVDLSYLDNSDAFATADWDENTNTITFNSGLTTEQSIDLSSLQTVSGTTSAMSSTNVNMAALSTSSISPQACIFGIVDGNVPNSMVAVYVNGVQVNVGNTIYDDCYFSDDGGTTPKSSGDEGSGDILYWNYNGTTEPNIGYELAITDRITFIHMTI